MCTVCVELRKSEFESESEVISLRSVMFGVDSFSICSTIDIDPDMNSKVWIAMSIVQDNP